MKDDEIRILIAEACGWTKIHHIGYETWRPDAGAEWGLLGQPPDKGAWPELRVPDYPNDLNAMHEALRSLDQMQGRRYLPILLSIMGGSEHNTEFDLFCATARQRAEAFLRTLGKWKE